VVLGGAAVWLFGTVRSLDDERVTDDVHRLEGLGGNVAVLHTAAGAVVVDTMTFRMQGQRIRERAEQLGGGPVQAVINTHYHLDHTHGNPGFAPGTRVVATARTLEYLATRDADAWTGAASKTLPNETFTDSHELRIGGKTIRCIHPGRGHTDGDLVVLFVEDRVLHTGDLFFHRRYPNVDLEAGGSVREWAATLDRVLALDFDRVVPGHGAVTDRAGLEQFRDFVAELAQVADDAVKHQQPLSEFLAAAPLRADAGYGTTQLPFVMRLDREFVLRRAYEEASSAREP
jgi:glyoxylase-like metal-dependent hydrolase (beta-lactamase superfamily II)